MSTRKIKDAKDLATGEKIYLKGHAKATYMSDGRSVEDVINSINTGGGVDLSGYATKTELEGKVDKIAGKQLSTEDFTTALKDKLQSLSNYDDTSLEAAISQLRSDFDKLVDGDTTTAIKTFNEIVAFLDGVSDSENLDSIIASIEQQIAAKQDKITDLDTIRANAAKGATALQEEQYKGTYSKPSGGIPSSDLSSDVQSALTKANSALQSETYKGTVTGVKINGSTKSPTNGTVDLGTVITSHQDISGKQDKLVSGTNIKTINGTSILGSGNIVIEGGGSSSGSGAYAEVNHGTSDTTFTLTSNTFHVWDEVASLDLSFADETAGVANEYLFQFTSGATTTTLTLPDVKWANDAAPVIEANKIYQISVLKGLGSVLSFSNEIKLFPVTLVIGETSQQGADVYNYLYSKYGETTTIISEELYFDRNGYEVLVDSIQYGTFEGVTGYWLNGYFAGNLKQVLTQDGSLIQRYPVDPEMP